MTGKLTCKRFGGNETQGTWPIYVTHVGQGCVKTLVLFMAYSGKNLEKHTNNRMFEGKGVIRIWG